MQALLGCIFAVFGVQPDPAILERRRERLMEAAEIVRSVAADVPEASGRPSDLPLQLKGALSGWLGEEWRA